MKFSSPCLRLLPSALFLLGFCFSALKLIAVPSATSALPVIRNPETEAVTAVKPTGELLRLRGDSSGGKLPAGSAAAQLAEPGVCFKWTPSHRDTTPLAEADLMDAVLSPDESTVLLVERIGGSDAPNSTRFLFVSVAGGGIVRAIEFPRRRITEVVWDSSAGLFARQEAQPEFRSPAAFLRISLPDGTVSAASEPLAVLPTAWCVGGGFLWFGETGGNHFLKLPADTLAGAPEKTRSGMVAPRPLWLPAQRQLAIYGNGAVEFYRMKRGGTPELIGDAPLPAGFAPRQAVALDGKGEVALLQPGEPALVLSGGTVRRIGGRTGKLLCFLRKSSLLLVEEQVRNSLLPCKMPSGTPGASFAPGKLKPLNRNANFRLLPLSGSGTAALLVDSKANLYRLDLGGKRPKKSIVYESLPVEMRRH